MPEMPPPSPATLGAFLLIVVAVVAAFLYGARSPAASAGALGWLAVTAFAPAAFAEGLPAPAFFGAMTLITVGVAFSRLGTRLSELPLPVLVGFQAFRLPLELVLHEWAGTGTVPPQMTWTGHNWDIASGVVALAAAPLARRRPPAWIASVVGFLLLLNVFRVVALSVPGPLQSYPEPVLLPFHFPTVWIGSVCVMGALLGHLVTFRALLRRE